jgi:Cu-Zn family superoxide dismutase
MNRVVFAFICLAAGGAAVYAQGERHPASSQAPTATAQLKNGKGERIGEVKLRDTPNGVLLQVELESVEPGVKGFHIHDVGRCEAPAFQSAGPHFNPTRESHGLLASSGAHAGDLPNIHVPETGMASVEVLASGVTLAPGERSLLDANGAAVVLHANADDYASDPAGNAGDRIACGVIAR